MARKKRNQLSVNKEWYNRYRNALRYLGKDIKELSRPTKKHVDEARKEWKKTRKELKSQGWIDLPTVYQASAMVEEKPTVSENYSAYLDTYITNVINQIQSKDYEEIQRYNSGINAVAQLNEAKNNLLDQLAWARTKIQDDEALAKAISKSKFVERALNTVEYYTRTHVGTDALTYMEDVVTPVFEQAINDIIREM